MKFYRIWLLESILDIAYDGERNSLWKEMLLLYPATLSRIEEITFSNFEIIRSEKRAYWSG